MKIAIFLTMYCSIKDIKMTTNYEEVEWIFYQMDNGLFYDSKLVVK